MTSSTTPGPAAAGADTSPLQPLAHTLGQQLQLWRIDLDAYAEQHGLEGLSADEHQRAERLAFAHLSRRSLASRHVLRRLLGSALGRSPQGLRFTTDRFGKPALADASDAERPALHFSVSHREQHALIGLHETAALGVDIELMRPMTDLDGLAQACFSAAERRVWASLDGTSRLAYFFACWTRKEASVKALGIGMSAPLPAIDVGGRAPYEHALHLRAGPASGLALEVHSLRIASGPADLVAACAWTDARSVALAHDAWG